MVKLHLVGFSSDLKSLVFSTRRGAKSGTYTVDVNPRLKRTLEEIASRQAESDEAAPQEPQPGPRQRRPVLPEKPPVPPSKISPKEIQALLREGKTPDEIARIAETDVSWIERFTSPIIGERAVVVDIVKAARISRVRRGLSSMPIGEAILANLADKKLRLSPEEFDAGWTAVRREGQWEVTFAYTSRGRDMDAAFVLDYERTVRPLNSQASALGWRPLPGEEEDEDLPIEGRGPALEERGEPDPVGRHEPAPARRAESSEDPVSGRRTERSGEAAPAEGKPASLRAAHSGDREVKPRGPEPGPAASRTGSQGPAAGMLTEAPEQRPGVPPPSVSPARKGWSLPARRVSPPTAAARRPASPREDVGQAPPKPAARTTSRKAIRPERPVPAGSARTSDPATRSAPEPATRPAAQSAAPRTATGPRAGPVAPKAAPTAPKAALVPRPAAPAAAPKVAPARPAAPAAAPKAAPVPRPAAPAPPRAAPARAATPPKPQAISKPGVSSRPAAPRLPAPAPLTGASGPKATSPPAPRQRTAAAEGPSAGARARRSAPPKQASSPVRTSSERVERGRTGGSAKPPAGSKAGAQSAKPAGTAKTAGSAARRRREPTPPLRPGQAVSLADVGWSLPADRAAKEQSSQDRNPPGQSS